MAGAEIDIDLGPLEIMAGLKAELATMNKQNAEAWRRREQQRARVPMTVRQFASAVIPTPTVRTGISFAGPDPGYYWMLRRLIIGGLNWKTTAAGTAEIYVTALSAAQGQAAVGPIVAGLALSDMVDQAATLPNVSFYSDQQVVIQEQENLVVLIDTGTAGQQYVCTGLFQVFRTLAVGIEFST
jgi:hypothetical protein